MTSIALGQLSIFNAEQFKESVSEPSPNTRMYLTYGRIEPWANDAAPPVPNTSVASAYSVWRKMIGAKRITGANIRHVVQRNNWTANTAYSAYDDTNTDLYSEENLFYVVTDTFDVYKCIANGNNAVSTVKPSYVSAAMGTPESDGYIWKYMYTINSGDQLNYLTTEYMPVNTLTADDGSIQWTVQNEAVDGGIHNIVITSGGSGYTNASNLVVSVSGDGSGFTATANINATSQTVSTITITNPGLNYTFGTVSITGGGGTGATGRAIMSPPGGHGSDALYELGGSRLIVSVKVRGSEDGILPVTNDLRQIALVKDPYLNETTTIASNNAFFQGHTIVVTGSGDYIDDEFIYQGTSLAAATYRARVLEWDSANGIIKATETLGEPSAASLLGATSATTRFVSSFEKEDLEPHSGQLLYIDNIKPITRAADQTENYKIVLKF